ncbi:MAG: asparagine synthase (glutamine-hydrolyzing) [Nitrospirota bacterium]
MCGISGILDLRGEPLGDRGALQSMTDVIRHRGPDEEGFYLEGEIGLGIRRLKVIDLATGRQPIRNEDGTVWTVFNGEIYNYRELRALMEQRGHRYATQTDTESIVHLYEEYGLECVQHLRGMFGVAIWDVKRKRLVLLRDRVGVKQLYYAVGPRTLRFGSEIKCLLQDPAQDRALDWDAVDDFFQYGYIAGDRTIFRGIRRVLPGEMLVAEQGKWSCRRYWDLSPQPREDRTEQDIIEEFRVQFREAVRLRLVSDVPVGAFLSGGIDSSAIVAEMAALTPHPVKTFTIGYGEEGAFYDERPYARLVADRFGTDHHEVLLGPPNEDLLSAIVRSFDEPFGDSSVIPNYVVSKLAREHVTVALSGVGGDEVGAGYERYVGVLLAERYHALPRVLRERIIRPLVEHLPDSKRGWPIIDRAKRFVAGAEGTIQERYHNYAAVYRADEMRSLFNRDARNGASSRASETAFAQAFSRTRSCDPLTQMMFCDLAVYLPDDLLVLSDRLSMAHSLEVRAPFIDHRLLEFSATIPSHLKMRGLTKKYLLKQAFAPILPAAILSRKKRGFSVPLAAWLRGALRPALMEWLSETRVKRLGLFNQRYVATLVSEHLSCRHNHENRLWLLLMFSMWHHRYVERG